jgi:predicted Zn-dependent protease
MNRAVIGAVVAGCLLIGVGVSQWSAAQHRSWLTHASIQTLDEYVSAHPDDVSAKVRLGQLNVANKDPRGFELLKAAADASPGDEAVWFAYCDAILDPNEAMSQIETYLKVLPDSTKLRTAKARRMVELGDPNGALSLVDELIKVSEKDADVLRARADAFMLLRRVSEASDTLQAAIKLDDRAELRLLLAMTLVPQQRYKELRGVCSPMVASNASGIAEGHKLRARVYLAGAALNLATPVDDIKKTAADLEDLLTKTAFLDPQEQFLPHYFLGECYLRLGRTEDASIALAKAVSMAPHFPAALYSLARSVQASKDSGASSVLFKRHAQLTSLLSQIDSLSTRAQEKTGDAALAKQLSVAQENLSKLLQQPLPALSGN